MAKRQGRRQRVEAPVPDLGADVEKEKPPEPVRDGEGKPPETVATRPVICKRCNSPNRKAFKDGITRTQDFPSMRFDSALGRYNRIVWRRTKCLDCGQVLIVKEYTIRPG